MGKSVFNCTMIYISISYSLFANANTTNIVEDKQSDQILKVYSTPLHTSREKMATPIVVITQEDLRTVRSASIAETLTTLPGFRASFFGGGSVHPVVRGMSGNRVKVLHSGSDLMDVSSIGADHAITSEPFLSQRIEVLKGSATLLYGGGTIGGAINVIDNKIPLSVPDKGYQGELHYQYDSVSKGNTGAAGLTLGQNNFALRIEGSKRQQGNYQQPVPLHQGEDRHLAGSYQNNQSANIGTSWIFDDGYIGISYGEQHRRYGLPGHTHFHSHEDEHHHDTVIAPPSVGHHHHNHNHVYPDEQHVHGIPYIEMNSKRWDLRGEKNNPFAGIESIRFNATRTNYHHDEKEGSEITTQFKNKGDELRLTFTHQPVWGWHGVIGGQFNQRDFSAQGEEAYVPPTKTKIHSLFLLEEYHLGDFRYELGFRQDWQSLLNKATQQNNKQSASSISAGLAWNFTQDYFLNLSLSHAKRSPVAEELYANGIHAASRTIEKGDANLTTEVANNIDLGITKVTGDIQFNINAYYNRINNYIYGKFTGPVLDNGYRSLQYIQHDAEFKGIEGNIDYYYYQDNLIGISGDYVRANLLHNKGNIPRMPAYRLSAYIKHHLTNKLTGNIRIDHFGKQNKTAEYETPTTSYNSVSLGGEYLGSLDQADYTVYVKVNNLFNAKGKDSTSYIKDEMYLPGRNIILGTTLTF
ncbi:TPA: TonB-dependent receptor [Proteus mirabilis]|uniref:TonB-dependent receptor domain-containing protein n=1 Tax=Proteus mirabilis TaxID=584 RepID=UPI000537A8B3|nr:TonB-dependent receptor [Proteus mirabilis]AUT92705.1 TonB-dependent receptor [Proteus mirabilis]AUU34409.1 TonB-dependent receptor [Proteus mirabilis]KAB7727482.1 TonB-dependent receptor [Proteus mirabilis]MBG2727793.1 TonB-dependent receptor [Proteus mirabilis]MBG2781427.1 TonB-dependent receptor [Proteus mirabilis]